jgi:NADPH:quinone reductase
MKAVRVHKPGGPEGLVYFHWVASGRLKVHVCGEYPLAEAAKAQAALEHRETIGKVLLIP